MIRKNGRTVTFVFNPEGRSFERVSVVGDFNDWQAPANPMARGPDGTYAATVVLPAAGEYQFRYVADENWLNDPAADAEVPNAFGSSNSVVRIEIPVPPAKPAAAPAPAKSPAAVKAPAPVPARASAAVPKPGAGDGPRPRRK
jgi:hypothetical protein